MNQKTISAILRGQFLIEPEYAISQGPFLASIFNRTQPVMLEDNEVKEAEETKPYILADAVEGSSARSRYSSADEAPHGSIAVVPVIGTMLKYDDGCGGVGMETLIARIEALAAHQNIGAILLKFDSPGGTVAGTPELATAIKSLTKPSLTYVSSMMCSAALWAGVQANEIIASSPIAEIGSVGVLISFADAQPYWEAQGVKFHVVTSTHSPDKVKAYLDMKKGDYKAIREQSLDPIATEFKRVVRTARPNVTDDQLTGKVYHAQDVIGSFIDGIGSFEFAVKRLEQKIKNQ